MLSQILWTFGRVVTIWPPKDYNDSSNLDSICHSELGELCITSGKYGKVSVWQILLIMIMRADNHKSRLVPVFKRTVQHAFKEWCTPVAMQQFSKIVVRKNPKYGALERSCCWNSVTKHTEIVAVSEWKFIITGFKANITNGRACNTGLQEGSP